MQRNRDKGIVSSIISNEANERRREQQPGPLVSAKIFNSLLVGKYFVQANSKLSEVSKSFRAKVKKTNSGILKVKYEK